MKNRILTIALMAITVGFSSCCAKKAAAKVADNQPSNEIIEKRWKLVELNGVAVEGTAFIIFHTADSRVSGTGGCNAFSGIYTLNEKTQRVRFSQLLSTQKACIATNYDAELAKVLDMCDNYSISEDGKRLSLNRARMAPLAVFEVEYL